MSTISAGTLINNGLNWSSDTTGNLVFLTNGTTTATTINTSQYMLGNVAGMGAGVYPAEQSYILTSSYTGLNATGAQSVFGLTNGVTLASNTVYQFEAVYALNKISGGTSHSFGIGFGGTANINMIGYQINGQYNASQGFAGVTTSIANLQPLFLQTATNTVLQTSITSGGYIMLLVKGIVSITTGGTFNPQYTLSAAPGGSWATAAGSYFKIAPLGPGTSNISNGTWS